MTIEEWTTNMMLVAYLRPNPNRYLKEEARKALKTWAKQEDKTTKDILKLIIRAKKRGELLRETHRNLTN
ncbi:MAG: hypothetical protein R3F02_18510 [Thiolinea sp.]